MLIGIIGYYGFNNLGDELNLRAIMNNMKIQYGHDTQFIVFSDCKAIEGQVDYRIVGLNYFPQGNTIDIMNRCDLLIIGGGGMVYLGEYWFPFMSDAITTPYVIYRVGIDDRVTSPSIIKHYQKLFDKSIGISVRDSYSLNAFMQYFSGQAERIPEAIWALPLCQNDVNIINQSSLKIGINLRCFGNNQPTLYAAFIPFLRWLKQMGHQIYFIPCQVMKSNLALNDNIIHRMIAPEDSFILNNEASLEERYHSIASMDICVGMRLHFLVSALKHSIPVIALNYHTKVKALMDDMNLREYYVDPYSSNISIILQQRFMEILKHRSNISQQLTQSNAVLAPKALTRLQYNPNKPIDTP
ncbi:MAG: hypothetical protein PWP48_1637 [Clostridiales bacterium]|jgi:polysaccharide pyruvyl transferase WcaK-like protein|nr:hypothetical protein [Clostridiales bacterium]MDK2992404.1 hypothetical protein [Clostridiales bacterium]